MDMRDEITLSGLNLKDFDKPIEGKAVKLFTLTNKKGVEVALTNYGAKLVSIMVPDQKGKLVDVITGHQTLADYLSSEEPYFGSICGRYANRIAKGCFTLDGITYDKLAINNTPNSLHGGNIGFNARVWDFKQVDDQTLELKITAADGEEGYPGKLDVCVTYHLTDNNQIEINYQAVTDKPTVLNLTNHSYFNLSGAGDPSIGDHLLTINADTFLPTDDTAIPYGPKELVAGTPMDFRTPYKVGERIDQDYEPLKFGLGYDHTYILNKEANELSFCARCESPKTGIVLEVKTTQPGVQLYTGNWMTGNFIGKKGKTYPHRSALCLETQHFPDSPNQPDYPSTVLRPGEKFESQTIFEFSTL